jgi:predicted nucleotidyltransferase
LAIACPIPVSPKADPRAQDFYVDALRHLDQAGVPYVVGGGYAMAYYTGIQRDTKDLDIFLKASDHKWALKVLESAGYGTEYFYPYWIAKALSGEMFIDILYNSSNGMNPVDDEWFDHAIDAEIHGYPTRLVPAEEQLWSKAFVQNRDRFDGADVHHLVLARGKDMDWQRLLRRFTGHEAVLYAHLVMFQYVYPTERDCVPDDVMQRLQERMASEPAPTQPITRGTVIAQRPYLTAVHKWGFVDGRLIPHGPLTTNELSQLPES